MKDACQLTRALFSDQTQCVVLRLTSVDDYRHQPLTRKSQLRPKHRVLNVLWRKVVVVIETNLADRADVRAFGKPTRDETCSRLGIVGELISMVRMHADREAHVRPRGAYDICLRDLAIVLGAKNNQAAKDAGGAGPRDDVFEVGGELFAG